MNARVLTNPFFRFRHNEHKAIAWAKVHATCKLDQLQNDALQIKHIETYIGKIGFFYVDYSFRHSHMGCGVYAPNVMTKLKKDNDLAYLIQISKVFYPKGFKDAWDN